jgi:raffinose/stachyose/melibiose transport system permease protein
MTPSTDRHPDTVALVMGSKGGSGRKSGSRPASRLITHGYWWWALPGLAAIFTVHYVATVAGAFFSFTDYQGYGQFNFLGLANYARIPLDPEVMASIGNTLFLAFGALVLSNGIGLGLALALNRTLKTRYALRTLLFLPVILSPIAVSYIFRFIFAIDGPMNALLKAFGYTGQPILWLASAKISIWVILVVVAWQMIGVSMVIFLAGLATVPHEIEEAAAIDGAGTFTRFFRITLPLIQPALAISTTLGLIQGLKIFDQVLAMTGGGPFGATETLSLVVYQNTFVNMRFGYGASIAMVLTVIILIASGLQLWLTRDRSGAHS